MLYLPSRREYGRSNREATGDARGRLSRQLDVELVEQHLRVGVRLRVSGQNQPAAVGGGNADIDHLNRGQFFQHGRGRESGGMRQHVMLQRDLKTVGQKRNQNVRVGAMFELMMDRADAQFGLE